MNTFAKLVFFAINHEMLSWIGDEAYIKLVFRAVMGKNLNLNSPKTFNEKLQWLKLYDRRPEYPALVDKYRVREYIKEKLGEDYLIPLLQVWSAPEAVDFDLLPDRFVMKCNHNSGLGLCICKDKASLDKQSARTEIAKGFYQDYFATGREWPYKSVEHRIIAEKYMCDDDSVPLNQQELTDYKFYCFNGYVDCVMICFDRASGDTKFYFFDKDWKLKRINKRGKEAPADFSLPKPDCLDEMFEIAATLSVGIPFVRVDLYQSNGHVYFGEMTFYPQSGWDPNYLPETDAYFGRLIDLSLAYNYKESSIGRE